MTLNVEAWHDLSHGITCIDANYLAPGIACFYLLEAAGDYAIIETGTRHSLSNLQALMRERAIDPERIRYIIPTHVHLDHAGGAGAMMALFGNATLLVHPRGARHMANPEQLIAGATAVYGEQAFSQLYGEVVAVDSERIHAVGDGESVELGGRVLQIRHTEGHARHHFCVWDQVSRGWFSGDMFGVSYPWFRFAGGDFILPSTTPTQFDPDAFLRSLQLLGDYQPDFMYLTHYGAIDYSAAASASLAALVQGYRELALSQAGDLTEALTRHALNAMAPLAGGVGEAQLIEWLAADVMLNAQGLAIWRDRQAGSA